MGAASSSPGPPTGRLYAFHRSSGASAFTIINNDDTSHSNTSSVVVGSQGNVLAFSRTQQGIKLVNFDIATQSITWRTPGTFNGRIAVDDGIIFAPNGIELSLFNESTGNRLDSWFAPAGESLQGNLIVSDDLIIAQTQRSTYAIRRSDLTDVWSTPLTGDLAYSDRTLFISYPGGVSAFAAVPEPASFGLLISVGFLLVCQSRNVR
jgi:outer membrane protein assembly factor BamB